MIAGDTQLAVFATTPRTERVLATTVRDAPGPVYVARGSLPAIELDALRAAMIGFTPDPARPAAAADARLHAVEPALLARLDPQPRSRGAVLGGSWAISRARQDRRAAAPAARG